MSLTLKAPVKSSPLYCDNQSTFIEAANKIANGSGPIAIDTERASGFKYFPRAYLLQFQREGSGTFLIDPIDKESQLTPLIGILKESEWILHAADQDLPALYALGFECNKLFDTEHAGRLLNLPKVNLAFMTNQLLGINLEKGYGQENWSLRPLPTAWLNYAALDVELLQELRNILLKKIRLANKLIIAEEEFEFKRLNARHKANNRVSSIKWKKVKGIGSLTPSQQFLAESLWLFRDSIAQKNDLAPHLICRDQTIIDICKAISSHANLTQEKIVSTLAEIAPQLQEKNQWTYQIEKISSQAKSSKILTRNKAGSSTNIPNASKWWKQKPEAAERLSKLKKILENYSVQLEIAVENILTPKTTRILCWNKLTHKKQITNILRQEKTRDWQINLLQKTLEHLLIDTNSND